MTQVHSPFRVPPFNVNQVPEKLLRNDVRTNQTNKEEVVAARIAEAIVFKCGQPRRTPAANQAQIPYESTDLPVRMEFLGTSTVPDTSGAKNPSIESLLPKKASGDKFSHKAIFCLIATLLVAAGSAFLLRKFGSQINIPNIPIFNR